MSNFVYDVFISYSHNDADWVKDWLLPRLESAGLSVCIDYRDFTLGLPALDNMADAAVKSSKTLFVMTPNWTLSEFSQFEVLVTQTIDPIGRKGRLVPLMLKDCDLPARLQLFTYADFKDLNNWNTEIERVIATISHSNATQASSADIAPRLAPNLVHPYPLQANFTGRVTERAELTEWLSDEAHPIYELIAMGGMGKSAVTWYWLIHDVLPPSDTNLDGVMWWSFYQGESSSAKFVDDALKYVSSRPIDEKQLPTTYDRAQELRRHLETKRVLFVLDGFERQLRDYARLDAAYRPDSASSLAREARSCQDPNVARLLVDIAALTTRAKVLITTRLSVSDLQDRIGEALAGVVEKELKELQPDDAVAFMRAQGITKGTFSEINKACAEYGYHPLSLRLLSGLIKHDTKTPGDIAAGPRHDVYSDLFQRQHHVLEQAYEALPKRERALISRIAAFRAPVTYDALTIFNTLGSEKRFEETLENLRVRGWLQRDTEHNRYDLHPITRRYAYQRLTNQTGVHTKLRDYFATFPVVPTADVQNIEDLGMTIELYYHTIRAGGWIEGLLLLQKRLVPKPLFFRFGAYQLIIELVRALFPDGEDGLPHLKNEGAQAWTLNALATSYGMSGQPRRATPLLDRQITIREHQGKNEGVAIGLGNIATSAQVVLGELAAAERSLVRSIKLLRDAQNEFGEAVGHLELGWLLSFRGEFSEAEVELNLAQRVFERADTNFNSVVYSLHAFRAMLMRDFGLACKLALKARALAESHSYARDIIVADWLVGAALVMEGKDLDRAAAHLSDALMRCRRINLVELEPDILLVWGRWHDIRGNSRDAQMFGDEARAIADRCEYRLKQAEIHNFLAALAKKVGERERAKEHATLAKERGWCDGSPHCYKPALDDAEAMLKELQSENN
jgi:tetratricopeptide (TPR) repeat protein